MSQELKVLVADDFEMVRTMLKKALSEIGIENVHEASSIDQARQIMETAHTDNEPFNIVFLDWNFPSGTGFELLQEWRGNEKHRNTAIIMVTAESEMAKVMSALKAGANDFIVKPVSIKSLKTKIEHISQKFAEKFKQTA